jgi:hypothetical protein
MNDRDRTIVLKVNLNQHEYDTLAATAQATGYAMGAVIRNFVHRLPQGLESNKCQAPQL